MMLLLYSGARTAMVGFVAAAPVVVLLSGGKKAALGSVAVGVVLVPVFWATGIHSDFFGNCIFRTANYAPAPVTAPATSNPDGGTSTGSVAEPKPEITENLEIPVIGIIPDQFFEFTGRTSVWKESLGMFPESPLLGYGFQADRYLLNTHAHNSFVHALLQTGAIGTIPFLLGLLLAWFLLIKTGLKQFLLSQDQKSLFIQVSGMLVFLSVRSITESTGAFFGVDWLLLGPILLFLQVVNSDVIKTNATSQRIGEHNSDKRHFS
jgi:hypothetical protein